MLSFSFLFPIFLLTTIVHEVGNAVVAFALGVRVLAIELYQDAACIRTPFETTPSAVSYSVFLLGGYLAQYAFGLLTQQKPERLLTLSMVPGAGF